MAIIFSEDGKSTRKIEESGFPQETNLQEYIIDNPEAIPIYEIDEDTRLFIAAREFSTRSGSIDALGFDANGNIYVIETKLYKNPDKRTVVAQALDYGASLWRNAAGFDEFIVQLDSHCQDSFCQTFREKYAEFFALEDTTESLQAIKVNLNEGAIKFVVLMDYLHTALKDLIVFINQNSKFDLYAVELEYYKHDRFEIVIPKIFGAEVKKDTNQRSAKGTVWEKATNEEFWQSTQENQKDGVINSKVYDALKTLEQVYTNLMIDTVGGRITWWRKHYQEKDVLGMHFEDTQGKIAISMGSDGYIGYWRYKKTGVYVDFMDELLKELVKNNLFEKSDGWLKGYDWYSVNLSKSNVTDSDIDKFLKINQSLLQKLGIQKKGVK